MPGLFNSLATVVSKVTLSPEPGQNTKFFGNLVLLGYTVIVASLDYFFFGNAFVRSNTVTTTKYQIQIQKVRTLHYFGNCGVGGNTVTGTRPEYKILWQLSVTLL